MREARDTSRRSGGTCRGSQELRRVGDLGMVRVQKAKTAEGGGGGGERRETGGNEQPRKQVQGMRGRRKKRQRDFDYGSRNNTIT